MSAHDPVRVVRATAAQSGAVAILQLHGRSSRILLCNLTGRERFEDGRLYLIDFAGIDRGLAVCRGDDWAQLFPHGGPRVVQKITEWLVQAGAVLSNAPDPRELYPEADSDIEADMLAALARAASPAAIDLLAVQPQLWRAAVAGTEKEKLNAHDFLLASADPRDHLLTPPSVVVVGRPNVGKSTLTNRLMGRAASLVADLPGTTRDWVGGLVEIALGESSLALRWLDTPGLRTSDDAVEQRAIELARRVVAEADVLIAMRDPDTDWPAGDALPHEPRVWLVNKVDQPTQRGGDGLSADAPLAISALHGHGLDHLQRRIVEALGLDAPDPHQPWVFSETLHRLLRGGGDIAAYLAPTRRAQV